MTNKLKPTVSLNMADSTDLVVDKVLNEPPRANQLINKMFEHITDKVWQQATMSFKVK